MKKRGIAVQIYDDHIELYEGESQLCSAKTSRFKNASASYQEAVVELLVDRMQSEAKNKAHLDKVIQRKGGGKRWTIMN